MSNRKTKLLKFGGRSLSRLINLVKSTSELKYDPPDALARLKEADPCILAGWHGQFMMLPLFRPEGVRVSAMVARHGDAELIGQAMAAQGVELIRGAGAGGRKRDRGGLAALRASVEALKGGSSLVMTADIPPGPARISGAGIVIIARMSGCPIVPAAAATSRFTSFDTWSRLTLNLPFSTIGLAIEDPIQVPADADAAMVEKKRQEVEAALNRATERAYALAGADINRAMPLDRLAAANPPPPGTALKIYRAGTRTLRSMVPSLLRYRARRGKEDLTRSQERLGIARQARPDGRLLWFHAASVGETNAILPLITSILDDLPDAHVLLTTGTTTSSALADQRLPDRAFHQFVPLDVPDYARRFFEYWQPEIGVFTESDIWPNLILEASSQGIPLALINARMSPRSLKRWRKRAKIGRALFSRFSVVLTQNHSIARVVRYLGAPEIIIAGNLKFDAPAPVVDETALASLKSEIGGRPIFLAASTHAGEDETIADAHAALRRKFPELLTIIVPRHPDRGANIAALLRERGLTTGQRSQNEPLTPDTEIYVADTIGELGTFYRLAQVAFIGGSLIEHGGQNPMEAVAHDTCIISGPHYYNFSDAFDALKSAKAIDIVEDAGQLADKVSSLLYDEQHATRRRRAGQKVLDGLGGAMKITKAELLKLLAKNRTECRGVQ